VFTDCPNCFRQFRLGAAHLSAAAGEVRCGFCGAQFNALSRLRDAPLAQPGRPDPAPPAEPVSTLEEPEFDIALNEVRVEPPAAVRIPVPRPAQFLETEAGDAEAPRRSRIWTAAALVLVLAGAAQVAWFQRDEWVTRFPALFPHVEKLCGALGCSVMRQRKLSAISVLNRDVRAHPRYRDALLVNATLSNGSALAQAFPDIQLSLSDTSGRVVAARTFAPDEYLDDSIDRRRGMAPGAPVHVVLEIAGVAADAVSFEIGFR
jgi:predicted Zn finger-like uncharacterized protein